MKKIYEIPEVTIFEIGVPERMIADSIGISNTGAITGAMGNSNSLDDQESTPWYRQ